MATLRLRELARALRTLRTAAGMSAEDAYTGAGLNEASLSRAENAHTRPQKRTLLALLDLYGADAAERAEVLALWADAGKQDWWRPYGALDPRFATYLSFEQEASRVRTYESLIIPGLLQTEAYARAVLEALSPEPAGGEVEQRLRARMERQAVLYGEDVPRLWVIVDEAALRREVGGAGVMREQMGQLVDAARRPNVTLQVIPFRAGGHAGMLGAFSVAEFPGDSRVVYVESLAGDMFLEADRDVRRYTVVFDSLRAVALSPADSLGLVAGLAGG